MEKPAEYQVAYINLFWAVCILLKVTLLTCCLHPLWWEEELRVSCAFRKVAEVTMRISEQRCCLSISAWNAAFSSFAWIWNELQMILFRKKTVSSLCFSDGGTQYGCIWWKPDCDDASDESGRSAEFKLGVQQHCLLWRKGHDKNHHGRKEADI